MLDNIESQLSQLEPALAAVAEVLIASGADDLQRPDGPKGLDGALPAGFSTRRV
jgi:hypothetical protein